MTWKPYWDCIWESLCFVLVKVKEFYKNWTSKCQQSYNVLEYIYQKHTFLEYFKSVNYLCKKTIFYSENVWTDFNLYVELRRIQLYLTITRLQQY